MVFARWLFWKNGWRKWQDLIIYSKVFIARLGNVVCPVVIFVKWMEKVAGSDYIPVF
jgi:hypothetical protein